MYFFCKAQQHFLALHKIYLLKSIFAFKKFQKCEKGVELLMQSTKVFACGAHTTSAKTLIVLLSLKAGSIAPC